MPFTCAKAVCATFCAPIAGALIPIFGPDFPSQCTSPEAPEHGRMAIDPKIVAESAREAELFRRVYVNASSVAANSQLPEQQHHHHHHVHHTQTRVGGSGHNNCGHGPALPSPTSIPSPRLVRRALNVQQQRYGSPYDFERERAGLDDRMRFHHKSGPSSPYGTDSEPDVHHHHHTGPEMPSLHHALDRGGLPYSPLSPPRSSGHGSSWTVVNHPPHHHSPSSQHPQQGFAAPKSSYPPSTYRESDLPCSDSITGSVVPGPNPILSAIPRFGQIHGLEHHRRHQSPHSAHQQQQEQQQRLPPLSSSMTTSAWQHNDTAPRDSLHNFHPPLRPNRHHHIPYSSAAKRPAAEVVDAEYDECSTTTTTGSDKSSPTATTTTFNTSLCSRVSTAAAGGGGGRDDDRDDDRNERYYYYHSRREPVVRGPPLPPAHARQLLTSGVDKSAALLLMNLSVRDHKNARRGGEGEVGGIGGAISGAVAGSAAGGRALRGCGPESMSMSPVSGAADGHRSKRRRATSI